MNELLKLLENLSVGDSNINLANNPDVINFAKKVMAHGAMTEKAKLQGSQDKLQNKIASLEDSLFKSQESSAEKESNSLQLSEQLQAIQEQINEMTTLQEPEPEPKDESESLKKQDVAKMISDAFNTNLPDILKTTLEPFTKKLSSIQEGTVEEYRNRKLKELGDDVIPQMVQGSTKEAIDKSIATAKEVRRLYGNTHPKNELTTSASTTNLGNITNTPSQVDPKNTIQTPTTTSTTAKPPEKQVNIKGMDDASFAKNREKLAKEISSIKYQG
jgi:hypothetical protein